MPETVSDAYSAHRTLYDAPRLDVCKGTMNTEASLARVFEIRDIERAAAAENCGFRPAGVTLVRVCSRTISAKHTP